MGAAVDLRRELEKYGVDVNRKASYSQLKEVAAQARYLKEQAINIKNLNERRIEQLYKEQRQEAERARAAQLADPNYIRQQYADTETGKLYLVSREKDEWGRNVTTTTPEKWVTDKDRQNKYKIVTKAEYEQQIIDNQKQAKHTAAEQREARQIEEAAAKDLALKQELLKKSGMAYDVESAKKAVLVSPEEYKKVVEEKALRETPEYKVQQEREMLGKVQEGLAISAKNIEEMQRAAPEYKAGLQALQSGAMSAPGGYTVTPSGELLIGTSPGAVAAVEEIGAAKRAIEEQKAFEQMMSKVQEGLAISQASIESKAAEAKVKEATTVPEVPYTTLGAPGASIATTKETIPILEAGKSIFSPKILTAPIIGVDISKPSAAAPSSQAGVDILQSKVGMTGTSGMGAVTGGITLGKKDYSFYTATDIGGLKAVDAIPKKLKTTDPMGVEVVRQRLCGDDYVCKTYDVTYKSGQVTDLAYVPRTQLTEYDWEKKRLDSLTTVPKETIKELEKEYSDPFGTYKFKIDTEGEGKGVYRYEVAQPGVWGKIKNILTPPWVKREPNKYEPVTVQESALSDITGNVLATSVPTTTRLMNEQKAQQLTGVGMRGITTMSFAPVVKTEVTKTPVTSTTVTSYEKIFSPEALYPVSKAPTLYPSAPTASTSPTSLIDLRTQLEAYPGYDIIKTVLPGVGLQPEKLTPTKSTPITTQEGMFLEAATKPKIDLKSQFWVDQTELGREQLRIKQASDYASKRATERLGYITSDIGKQQKIVDDYNKQMETVNKLTGSYNTVYDEYSRLNPDDYILDRTGYLDRLKVYETAVEQKAKTVNGKPIETEFNELNKLQKELENRYRDIKGYEIILKDKERQISQEQTKLVEEDAKKAYDRIAGYNKEISIIDELFGTVTPEGKPIIRGSLPISAASSIERVKRVDPLYAQQQDYKYAAEHFEPLKGKSVGYEELKKSKIPGAYEIGTFYEVRQKPEVQKAVATGTGFVMEQATGALEFFRNLGLGLTVEPYRAAKRDIEEGTFATKAFTAPLGPAGYASGLILRGIYDPSEKLTLGEEARVREIKKEGTLFQKAATTVLPGYETKFRTKAGEGVLSGALIGYGAFAKPGTVALAKAGTAKRATFSLGRTALKGLGYGLLAAPVVSEGIQVAKHEETPTGALMDIGHYSGKVLGTIGTISLIKAGPLATYQIKLPGETAGTADTSASGVGWRFWTGRKFVGGPIAGTQTTPTGTKVTFGTPEQLYTSSGVPFKQAIESARFVTIGSKQYPINMNTNSVKIGSRSYPVRYDLTPEGKYSAWVNYKGGNYQVQITQVPVGGPIETKILTTMASKAMAPEEFAKGGVTSVTEKLWTISGKQQPGQQLTQPFKSMSAEAARKVFSKAEEYKYAIQQIYGSGVLKPQAGSVYWSRARGLGQLPGDIDIQTRLSEADAKAFAEILKGELQVSLGAKNVRVPTGTSLVQTRVNVAGAGQKPNWQWMNAVDVHPLYPTQTELASISTPGLESYGIKYSPSVYQVPVVRGQPSTGTLPVSVLGKQVIAGQSSILGIGPSPATGEIMFMPEAHRLKDIPTMFAAAEKALTERPFWYSKSGTEQLARQLETYKSMWPKGLFPKEAQTTFYAFEGAKPATPWFVSPTTYSSATGFPAAVWTPEQYYALRGIRLTPMTSLAGGIKPAQPILSMPPAPSSGVLPSAEYLKIPELSSFVRMSTSRVPSYSIGSAGVSPSVSLSALSKYVESVPSPSPSPTFESYIPPPPSNGSKGSEGSGSPVPSPISPSPTTPSRPSPVTQYKPISWPQAGFGMWPGMGSTGTAWQGVNEWMVTNPIRDLPGEWLAAQRQKDITELAGVGMGSGLVPRVTPEMMPVARVGGKLPVRLMHRQQFVQMPIMTNFKMPKQEKIITGHDRAKNAVNRMFNAEGLSDRKVSMLMGRGKHGKKII